MEQRAWWSVALAAVLMPTGVQPGSTAGELAYEGQSYGIAEIGPSGVRYPITAYGGGC